MTGNPMPVDPIPTNHGLINSPAAVPPAVTPAGLINSHSSAAVAPADPPTGKSLING
jgi:hypothetical protein